MRFQLKITSTRWLVVDTWTRHVVGNYDQSRRGYESALALAERMNADPEYAA